MRQAKRTMDEQRGNDEFERIQLHQDIERARYLIGQYDTHQAFYRGEIEAKMYQLGKLDERLGDGS
jgi:hypothetical protein